MNTIANTILTLANIPDGDSDWHTISEFALTFDAYEHWGSFEACAAVANAPLHNSLTELRTCLFFEQRRWRHFGETPNSPALAYVRELVEQLRRCVETGNIS